MYDVIVVGARCAGASIAMLMGRRGYRVLLLERDEFPCDMHTSTHLIHALGVSYLRRWGLLDAVMESDTPSIESFYVDMGPIQLAGKPPAVDGSGTALAPRRIALDQILVQGAIDAGVEFRDATNVTGLVDENKTVVGVNCRSSSGAKFAERGRIVIGADGPGSMVAKSVTTTKYNEKPACQGTAWAYWEDVDVNQLELYLREYEAVYAFPTTNNHVLIGGNWAIDRFVDARQDIEGSYHDLLRRTAPELAGKVAESKQAEKFRVGSTRSFLRKPYGPGWALIGDAGYKKDPCTAQGISDAFYDAQLLATAIDDVFAGNSVFAAALEKFHQKRDEHAMPYYEMTSDMARFAPPDEEQLQLYMALNSNQAAAEKFFGLISQAVNPADFFSPENMADVMANGAG